MLQWFKAAGFQDVKIKRIGPSWYRGVRRHGLIMGCSVTGVKAQVAPAQLYLQASCSLQHRRTKANGSPCTAGSAYDPAAFRASACWAASRASVC